MSSHANLFESLKLRYFGPIDGHNISKLVDTLNDLKQIPPKAIASLLPKAKDILRERIKPGGMLRAV